MIKSLFLVEQLLTMQNTTISKRRDGVRGLEFFNSI